MQAERWQRIDYLFHAALEHKPDRRVAFLTRECENDESLLSEVEALLASHEAPPTSIEMLVSDVAADLLADARLEPGTLVGHYKIIALLGKGGMGQVFLAEDTRLHRRIALKLLPAHFTVNPDRVRRFEREARAASALNHPNIVTVYEIGEFDATDFIATEFVDGKTMRQLIDERRLTLGETLNLVIQVATGLAAAHTTGIIHRDIKPENLMVRADGYVKILDFGLAKLTEQQVSEIETETPTLLQSNPGLVMGTVQYMSPEQTRGRKVDARTDIWSLGIVLYELVSGQVPFTGETPSHVMVSVMEDELRPLADCATVPAELDRIVTKSLRKNKKERYETARELAHDLKSLNQELQVEGRLKRSLEVVPSRKERTTGAQASSLATAFATKTAALQSATTGVTPPTSSAEYLVGEIKRHQRSVVIIAATVVIAIAVTAYFYLGRNHLPIPAGDAIDSIAVLPFVNEGGDSSTQYLCEGITDSIINSLWGLPSLRVVPFNSVISYKGKQTDPQSAAKALNVRAVLVGRLRQEGDNLIVSTELVDARDNRLLWAEKYNRKLADILVVQTAIAQEISQNLRLRLSPQDQKQLAKRYTENTEAYRLYILGSYSSRGAPGKEKLAESIKYFEQAIKLDPRYALAYAGLANTYKELGLRGFLTPKEAWQRVQEAALKALELDDTLAEAHLALSVAKVGRDWEGAGKEAKRALELDPNSAAVNRGYAIYLAYSGRSDEALEYAKRAEDLDSRDSSSLRPPASLPLVYFLARKYDLAIEGYRKALENNPNNAQFHFFLGEAYVAKGNYQDGVPELQKAVALDNVPERWDRHPVLAFAYAVSGQRDEAVKILNEQKRLAKQRYISPYNFAIIYTGLGDKDGAFAALNRAVDEEVYVASQVPARPMFDSLRSDPRYKELLRRMNREQ
jgi:eukaryotic-like serine/threonine-protein kinase